MNDTRLGAAATHPRVNASTELATSSPHDPCVTNLPRLMQEMTLTSPNESVQTILRRVFGENKRADGAFIAAGMSISELVELYKLVLGVGPTDALEIGMANATSSVIICAALAERGAGRLTSIDPYQMTDYDGQGLANIARAGFAERHHLICEPNYLALSQLVRDGRKFGLVLIDGWHSFDHAMVDLFFADLLLHDGGILAFHDTDLPSIYKAVRFLETHKPYEPVSPPPAVAMTRISGRIWRRLRTAVRGPNAVAEARARRNRWQNLSAYRKKHTATTPERLVAHF